MEQKHVTTQTVPKKVNDLNINITYQSPVKHLPKHISPNSPIIPHSPTEDQGSYIDTIPKPQSPTITIDGTKVPTKLDSNTQTKVPYTPKTQIFLLISNISIFIASIILGIIAFIATSIDLNIITSCVLIISAILGLILSYSYKINTNTILFLQTKLLEFINQQNIPNITTPSASKHSKNEPEKISLLTSFRRGIFHKQLSICSTAELKQLLPIVAQTLCQLPFGLTEFRSSLFIILANRISNDASLDQAWRFFLNCNRDIPEIIRTWESHEYLKPEQTGNKLDDEKTDCDVENNTKDSVTFFRSLFKDLNKIGAIQTIPPNNFICDPINDNILVQIELKQIMPSNAKPYLLNCYTSNITSNNSNNKLELSSIMLLKKGDDLRKDLGVMLMFKFMNEIWKENNICYNGQKCETLIYNVIPMSTDFGAIEFVEGATRIKNIDTIIDGVKDNDIFSVTMERLIATGAASYVASYVLGVRDRHHDNILVCNDGRLFNIDFSHILGEKLTGLDASKIAIPNKFVKVLGSANWIRFVELAVLCFSILRKNYVYLLDFARIVFAFMKTTEKNEIYLKQSLMIDIDDKEASKRIKSLFDKAPSRMSTKLKNVMHGLAVRGKQRSLSTETK